MNKEEANTKLEEMQSEVLCKFCPQIKKKCRKDCASFYCGSVRENIYYKDGKRVEGEYLASKPLCTNAIVIGSIEIEH